MNTSAHTTSTPTNILEEANDIIYGDREKTYGHPAKNLTVIAAYWINHLEARFNVRLALTVDDVCVMMVLLKLARLANDLRHHDSKVDSVGYMALMERCQKFFDDSIDQFRKESKDALAKEKIQHHPV